MIIDVYLIYAASHCQQTNDAHTQMIGHRFSSIVIYVTRASAEAPGLALHTPQGAYMRYTKSAPHVHTKPPHITCACQ